MECLEPRRLLSVVPSVLPAPTGALSGRVVFTSAGHGYAADGNVWRTGRGLTNGMVEDMGNQDQLQSYADYLLNAGAMVVPLRPVGYQPNEIVLDNTSAGVTFSGSWSNSATNPHWGASGAAVTYRFASVNNTSETAVATYSPNIAQAGHYPVYTWVLDSSNRTNQLYRINHAGGSQEVRVDHRKVGKGWVYLGTYYFNAGTSGNVQISNRGDGSGGSVVIADGVRFGNGMGDIARSNGISGKTREDEASLYWIERSLGAGVSMSQFRTSSDDESANVGAPPRFSAYMNAAPFGQALYLGWHTNAANTSARGTVGLTNADGGIGATPNQTAWADLIGREITQDLLALGSPPLEFPWFDRVNYVYDAPTFDFGEITDTATGNEFDATIIEVAFHDNATDAALLRDPKVRDQVGKSSMHATIKYFNQFGGATNAIPPGMPTNLRATTNAAGDITLQWNAPVSNAWNGNAATGYAIELSTNGYAFGQLASVAGVATTSYVIPAAQVGSNTHYFRVRATNAGGRSEPSWVVGARSRGDGGPRVLVVNGFTRLERQQNVIQRTGLNYTNPSQGTQVNVERVRPRFSNSFDYVAQVGAAIDAYTTLPVGFDMVQKSQVSAGQVNLGNYDAVIWLAGEQSTGDGTIRGAEQTAITNYINAGGRLFVSGSELGWDLVANNNGSSFFTNTLKAGYVGDDAGTYTATGAAGSIFSGVSVGIDDGSQFYDVDFPDRLSAAGGSTIAMNYVGGTGGGAATQWASGRARVVTMGFPFETITTANTRSTVMARVLDYFQMLQIGDMNNDGQINNLDIAPFVQGLTSPESFRTAFGYSPIIRGDVNGDGAFNNLDIAPFVALLTGGRTAVAAPAPSAAPVPSRTPVRAPSVGLESDDGSVAGGTRVASGVLR
jgi:hypothetical protein